MNVMLSFFLQFLVIVVLEISLEILSFCKVESCVLRENAFRFSVFSSPSCFIVSFGSR